MRVDLLLRLQGVLGALGVAQWKHQQQTQSCQARHGGVRPYVCKFKLIHLQKKYKQIQIYMLSLGCSFRRSHVNQ